MSFRLTVTIISLGLLLALWIGVSAQVNDAHILPPPSTVFAPFMTELQSGELLYHLSKH